MPKNEFYLSILQRKSLNTSIKVFASEKLGFTNKNFTKRDIHFLINEKGAYLIPDGSSRIYCLKETNDSILVFVRLDNNIDNINYNIDAYHFSFNNELYNYGGYGFWKSNGLLRKFNFLSREWDIIPLNDEIHNRKTNNHVWQNPNGSELYILFEMKQNDGIKNKKNPHNLIGEKSYRINLLSMQIEELGTFNKEFLESILDASFITQSDSGIYIFRTPDMYLIKPALNKVYKIKDITTSQTIERLTKKSMYYFWNGKIFFKHFETSMYDSINLSTLQYEDYDAIWTNQLISRNQTIIYSFIVTCICVAVYFYIRESKKIKKNIENKDEEVYTSILSIPEIGLINFLLEQTAKGKTANTHDINYILGLKSKNQGLQKKIRSDIINEINYKFKAYNKRDIVLIHSTRNIEDKRYYNYFISDELIDTAKVFVSFAQKIKSP